MGPSFRRYPTITIRLFKTLLQPILIYTRDFWGTLKLPKNNPIETLFMRFCKELLGVQRQTTNAGVLLELGETPLSFTGTRNAIKKTGLEYVPIRRAINLLYLLRKIVSLTTSHGQPE